jgi:hypothetical protein
VRRRECVYVKLIFRYGQSVEIGKKLILSSSVSQHNKKKGGTGVYSVGFMKKVARMPVRDRKHILSILKKHKNKRNLRDASDKSKAAISSTSDSSKISNSYVNKDWENFVVLHGKPEKVAEDVRGIGRAVGVSYECDTKNSFDLLTKKGRREWRDTEVGKVVSGEVGGKVVEEGVC